MDNGYIIDTPLYNFKTGLYDVPLSNNNTISCYRILNNTKLTYSTDAGYFYLSMDDTYIFIPDDANQVDIFKSMIYSNNNPNITNQKILDINNDPYEKYSKLGLIMVPETMCINLALEDNNDDRLSQIKNNKYVKYDCLVKNSIDTFKNTNPSSLYETITSYISYSPSTYQKKTHEHNDCNPVINVSPITNIEDIHQYNQFYVYGLTSLNLLLIIIIVIVIITISNDSKKHNKHIRNL